MLNNKKNSFHLLRLCEHKTADWHWAACGEPSGKHAALWVASRASCIKFSSPTTDQNAGKFINNAGVHPQPQITYIKIAGSRAQWIACFTGNPRFLTSKWVWELEFINSAGTFLKFKRDEGPALWTDCLINSYFHHFLGRKYLLDFLHLVIIKTRTAACFQTFTMYQAVCKAFYLQYLIEVLYFREEKSRWTEWCRGVGSGAHSWFHLLPPPVWPWAWFLPSLGSIHLVSW